MASFLETLKQRVVIADGAMGTYLFAKGVSPNRCLPELNLSDPGLIRSVHQEYLDAGAEVLETNTFLAHRPWLRRFGLEEQTRDINIRGANHARSVAGSKAWVAGSVAPLGTHGDGVTVPAGPPTEPGAGDAEEKRRSAPFLTAEERQADYEETIRALVEGGADLLFFETFSDLEDLLAALRVARAVAKLPVIASLAFIDQERTVAGVDPASAARVLEAAGADVIGANCGRGPMTTLKIVEVLGRTTALPIAALPNAGRPNVEGGRTVYPVAVDYFAGMAERMTAAGANLVGGCCGTTPETIRTLARRLAGRPPAARAKSVPAEARAVAVMTPAAPKRRHWLDRIPRGETPVVVELDPPKGTKYARIVRGAVKCREAGVDAITVADNSLAIVRMDCVSMCHHIQTGAEIPTVMHFSCRDRNLIGMQSVAMGAWTLGIETVLALTGDPARAGNEPGASSVYDLNSFKLIQLLRSLNAGRTLAGADIGNPTDFRIGCAYNPNVRRQDPQIRRLEKKVELGAEFAMTQPCYDPAAIEEMYEKAQPLGIPILLGVMPLLSYKNAEYLHHEVPGISIPDPVRDRLKGLDDAAARAEGLAICKEIIRKALPRAHGIYVIPPFSNADPAVELARYVRSLKAEAKT